MSEVVDRGRAVDAVPAAPAQTPKGRFAHGNDTYLALVWRLIVEISERAWTWAQGLVG